MAPTQANPVQQANVPPVIPTPVTNPTPTGVPNLVPPVVEQQAQPVQTPIPTGTVGTQGAPVQGNQTMQTTMNNGIPIISFAVPNNNTTDGNM